MIMAVRKRALRHKQLVSVESSLRRSIRFQMLRIWNQELVRRVGEKPPMSKQGPCQIFGKTRPSPERRGFQPPSTNWQSGRDNPNGKAVYSYDVMPKTPRICHSSITSSFVRCHRELKCGLRLISMFSRRTIEMNSPQEPERCSLAPAPNDEF